MAKNFEIIFNLESSMLSADNTRKMWDYDMIQNVCESHNCKYILATHCADTVTDSPMACGFKHIHCGIHTESDNTYDTIAKWFGLATNSVNKIKGRFETTYALYLAHYNAKYSDGTPKPKIPMTDIFSNFDMNYDKLIGRIESQDIASDILADIANGNIRKFEFKDKLTDAFRIKYARQINNALDIWNDKKMRDKRDMTKNVYWIWGVAGLGKTELAKYFCKVYLGNDNYYMSDSGSNPFDNYADEPCIILDDVGADNLNGKVVLKLFDPHNKCFTKARYFNKALSPDMIIVTSSMSPESFWKACRDTYGVNGSWEQLTRRLNGGVYHFIDKENMQCTLYDSDGKNPSTVVVNVPDNVKNLSVTISADVRMQNALTKLNLTIKDGTISGDYKQMSLDELENPFKPVEDN